MHMGCRVSPGEITQANLQMSAGKGTGACNVPASPNQHELMAPVLIQAT